MTKIPKGHERSGIKINCSKCDRNIKEVCPLTSQKISSCKFKDKHKFLLICHIPGTRNDRLSKISDADTFNQALLEKAKFVEELKSNNYNRPIQNKVEKPRTTLFDFTVEYLNSLEGKNELEILNLKRSKDHIAHIKKVLTRFSDCLEKNGIKVAKVDVAEIGDVEANYFMLYLRQHKSSVDLLNKHFVAMKTFFNWIIDVKSYNVVNPFRKVELKIQTNRTPQLVSEEIFQKLLKIITIENGYSEFKKASGRQKGKNLYRPYLVSAFKLNLETGCRGEELTSLRWSHLKEISKGVEIFDINNLKVTRIQSSKSNKEYTRPIPVTKSLKALLIELGYFEKKGTDEYILERENGISEVHMAKIIGRAFNHYIKFVDTGNSKIEFKDLRKTYFTAITLALGAKAKMFTGHADEKVLENHYLAKEFIAGNLLNFTVYAGQNNQKVSRNLN